MGTSQVAESATYPSPEKWSLHYLFHREASIPSMYHPLVPSLVSGDFLEGRGAWCKYDRLKPPSDLQQGMSHIFRSSLVVAAVCLSEFSPSAGAFVLLPSPLGKAQIRPGSIRVWGGYRGEGIKFMEVVVAGVGLWSPVPQFNWSTRSASRGTDKNQRTHGAP